MQQTTRFSIKTVTAFLRAHRFACLNAGALFLSLFVGYYTPSFFGDIVLFHRWGDLGFSHELMRIYSNPQSSRIYIYPPLGIYLCVLLTKLIALLGLTGPSRAAVLMYKMPAILAVFCGGFLARDIGDRLYQGGKGLLIGALYVLNPALILISAVWGQWDSLLALGALAVIWAGVKNKHYLIGPIIGATLMVKPQIVFALPVLIIQGILVMGFRKFSINCLLGLLVVAVLAAPFVASGTGMDLAHCYVRGSGLFPTRSMSAYNFWQPEMAIEMAVSSPGSEIPMRYCDLAGFGLWGLIVLAALRLLRRGPQSWEACTEALVISFLGAFCVLTRMHERYVAPASALSALLVARGLIGGGLYGLLSLTAFLNTGDVYYAIVFGHNKSLIPSPAFAVSLGVVNALILLAMLVTFRRAAREGPASAVEGHPKYGTERGSRKRHRRT